VHVHAVPQSGSRVCSSAWNPSKASRTWVLGLNVPLGLPPHALQNLRIPRVTVLRRHGPAGGDGADGLLAGSGGFDDVIVMLPSPSMRAKACSASGHFDRIDIAAA